jgi:hypothetical protein
MKQLLAIACLLWGMAAAAQKSDMQQLSEQIKKSAAEARAQRAKTDSLSKSINNMITRQYDSMQKAQIERDAQRSGEIMLQWHKERQAKQKRQMYIYLGLGVGFLGLLIFGLMRKARQKKGA